MKLRLLGGAVVAGLGAWTLFAIFVRPPPPHAAVQWESSRQCAECHALPFAEWQASWHAQAWTDVEVRRQSEDFANTDCLECHAPQPVFETGLGNRVLARTTRWIEGVDCVACHQMHDGRMAGTVDNPLVACRPVAQLELVRPEFCAGCHNQHGTLDQWKASRWAQPGPGFRDCVACHLPYRDAADPSQGRRHEMHGGHDLELVRSAVTLTLARVDGVATAEVENVGAGHNFPTDERSRAADVFWRPLPSTGEPGAWRHLYRFRNPYRYEVGMLDTELPAGQKVALAIDGPDASGALEVALFFKRTPYWADPAHADPEREAELVHRRRLER